MSRRELVRTARLAVALGGILLAAGCRRGMEFQPKVRPLSESDQFADQRSAREPVPGTIARGTVDADILRRPPARVTRAILERGQERYDIYCAVCHDRVGSGNGPIVQRGFPRPPSYHTDRLRNAPPEHFYDVITNGFGRMYSYADRVSPEDRWAIIAYIRALQLSQNATPGDAPPSERAALLKIAAKENPGGSHASR